MENKEKKIGIITEHGDISEDLGFRELTEKEKDELKKTQKEEKNK